MLHYSVFKTAWGRFGLLWSPAGLCRACLPMADAQAVRRSLLADLHESHASDAPPYNSRALIEAYFDGVAVDFSKCPVDLSGFGPFESAVLRTNQTIGYGKSISYTELAEIAGRPNAVRAAANAAAKNPLPLIIPCHRVLRIDGSLGGFSAPGGIAVKQRLLTLDTQKA